MTIIPMQVPVTLQRVAPYQSPVSKEVSEARKAIWLGQPHTDICVTTDATGVKIVRVTKQGEWPFWKSYGTTENRKAPVVRVDSMLQDVPTGELQIWAAPDTRLCFGYAT